MSPNRQGILRIGAVRVLALSAPALRVLVRRLPVAGCDRFSIIGNDSTLVAASFLRQFRLSARIAESSVRRTATSPPDADTADAASAIARCNNVLALRRDRHSAESTTMSTAGGS